MTRGQQFSVEERAAVVEAFNCGGLAEACRAVPQRSTRGVVDVLCRLGVYSRPGRRAWRTDEIRYLRDAWRAGKTAREIAQHLGRSRTAVTVKIGKLRLPNKQTRWTPGQDRIVYREVDALIERLAQRFGRTPAAVMNRLGTAVISAPKRFRRGKIVDLGGMRTEQTARPKERAA